MRITLKLFANLTDFLPAGSLDNHAEVEAGENDTVSDIIERYRLPDKLVHLVLVNGVYVAATERASKRLVEGDQLAVWPPIAGG